MELCDISKLNLTTLFDPARWEKQPMAKHGWDSPWLTDHHSLTARLKSNCSQTFKVDVLTHEFILAPSYLLRPLELTSGERVLRREVLLCDGAEPLVYACSLLPECALIDAYAELRTLGSRPLGHWLFSEPVLCRSAMQFASFDIKELPAKVASNEANTDSLVSARKTYFLGAEKPFLVSEFFLPVLEAKVVQE